MEKLLMQRHPSNKNLTIFKAVTYDGLPLVTSKQTEYTFIKEYLDSNKRVMDAALDQHPRTLAVRVDLRFPDNHQDPDYPKHNDKCEISTFMDSLKAQVDSNIARRRRSGCRVHNCKIRYIWVNECDDVTKDHYHVVLFFNKDTFGRLGSKNIPEYASPLLEMIVEAWKRALHISSSKAWNLVHIPYDATYRLKKVSCPDEDDDYRSLFLRLSYFTKAETKSFGTRRNRYRSSNV